MSSKLGKEHFTQPARLYCNVTACAIRKLAHLHETAAKNAALDALHALI